DPLVGTSGNGYDGGIDTFPGADAPFGMVQWSPDTPSQPAGGGYNYSDSTITGFTLTHLSGPGCNVFGDAGILPMIGPVTAPASASQAFSHASEVATPGYYEIRVGMPSVRVQLAATPRTGLGRFTFPPSPQADILVNASSNQNGVSNSTVQITSPTEIVGSASSGWFCGMPDTYTVYFVLDFDRPFTTHGTWLAKKITPDSDQSTGIGSGAYVSFDTTADPTVNVKVALSWVSLDGARANLRLEAHSWDVDAVRAAAHRAWNSDLGRVQIGGGTDLQRRVFYTALYHTMLHPNIYSDADGRYRGFDGQVHSVDRGHVEYATFSGWDIYRTEVPLLAMLEPARTSDMMRSLVHAAQQGGWLPKWSLVNGESAVMGGDPSDPIIAGAYTFGARDFDAHAALAAMVKGATNTGGPLGQGSQRPGLGEYESRGYVVNDHATNVAPLANGASLTLEYSLDDFSISQLARFLGDERTADAMTARSQNWTNLFDRWSGLITPRDSDGAFESAPLTENGQSGFQEGTAAQYTWMVPQGYGALIAGLGGRDRAVAALDAFFTQIDAGQAEPYAWMGNEPSIGSPWAYLAAGAPWKAQTVIRDVMTQLWGDTPDGIPGNDDLGTMSAWYVWCALGLYPQVVASPVLDLGAPLFPYARVNVPHGASIEIVAPGASADAAYVQSVRWGHLAWSDSWVPFRTSKPMRLTVSVAATPNRYWASAPTDGPPTYTTGPPKFPAFTASTLMPPTPGELLLTSGSSASFKFAIENAGTTPDTVAWTAQSDDPLTVTPLSGRLDAAAAAASSVTASVSVAPHTPSGLYDFSLAGVSGDGAAIARVTGVVQVMGPGNRPPSLAYVANFFDNEVAPFDPRTHAVGQPIVVGELPREVAISPDGRRVYASNNGANSVSVIDTATQSVIATINVGHSPWGVRVSPDSSTVWVANGGDNTIQPIDASTLVAGKAIPVGQNPEDIAISPDGSMLWVVDVNSGDVMPVNARTETPLDPIIVGPHPRGIAISPDGSRVFVSDFAGNEVTPIDTVTRKAGTSIPVGIAPRGLVVSPDGKMLYVADFGSNEVSRIDLTTMTALAPIQVGLNPVAVGLDSSGLTLFVVNQDDDDCMPIDLSTLRIGAPIPLGDRPMSFAR
ncbi:MAG TPA: GH92 family glycosyl hydrolase, partial [Candidatus Eremiobacteraceae bacterium]|nr:GH92 family glycosyl hydrolase [Candidatus Eremiobacteraceae bacterium]